MEVKDEFSILIYLSLSKLFNFIELKYNEKLN
jgi:hypothetical protein